MGPGGARSVRLKEAVWKSKRNSSCFALSKQGKKRKEKRNPVKMQVGENWGLLVGWMLLIRLGWRGLTSTVAIKCPCLRQQRKETLVTSGCWPRPPRALINPLCHNHWSDWREWWGQLTPHQQGCPCGQVWWARPSFSRYSWSSVGSCLKNLEVP